jgi:hypothetical protein
MLDDVVAFLDRRYESLAKREHVRDFLLHLEPFVAALDREPRLRVHLDDMVCDAECAHEQFSEVDRTFVARVKALRAKVPRLPLDDDAEDGSREERYGLDTFDRTAEAPLPTFFDRLRESGDGDKALSEDLVFRLRCRLNYAYPDRDADGEWIAYGDDVRALYNELVDIEADVRHARRRFSVGLRTSGTFALAKLRAALRQLNPPRALDETDEQSLHDYLTRIVADPKALLSLVHDGRTLVTAEYQQEIDANVRDVVERVYEELRRRIGSTLSLRSLMLRFKVRAESYDHDALCSIAGDDTIARKEDRLADRLAAFLFDQGLTPLTRPMIGRLSPDIVAPDLYVEAKQYDDGSTAKKNICKGANQVWDTFNRLRGTPHEVREAYLVVFRRKGPSVVFEQESVHVAGATLHAILVDVAPNEESGSRQKEKPVTITAADLLPQAAVIVQGESRPEAADSRAYSPLNPQGTAAQAGGSE